MGFIMPDYKGCCSPLSAPTWIHAAVFTLVCLTNRQTIVANANTTLCVLFIGSSPDTRNGPHHVHPADLDDGASNTAAQPPLHGQQWHSQ